ncbi:MAG TPA: cytochrome c peroxidase [Anaerolineae bacterium]|nr:cytochrome c peroxidase [Anaerolineae bacterium]
MIGKIGRGCLLLVMVLFLSGEMVWGEERREGGRSYRPELPEESYEYADIELPLHLSILYNNIPEDNPITNEGATLGRVLFYDRRLSANNQVACASCHLQAQGFSDPAALSTGFAGGHTRRNSMGLSNNRYFQPNHFFWDTRADSLEELVLLPIEDRIEMGSELERVIVELEMTGFYDLLFMEAFGTAEITEERIAKALAQFVRSIVSYQSKYDEGVGVGFENFTPLEAYGLQLFESHELRCNICHTTDTHVLFGARNNGLDMVYEDNGLGEITGHPTDMGRFKPPSLRNVAVTGPYMHDGRFETLEETLTHYQNGIKEHPSLDEFLPVGGFNFDEGEKNALLAYLGTLTDEALLEDPKYSDPFPAGWTVLLPVVR